MMIGPPMMISRRNLVAAAGAAAVVSRLGALGLPGRTFYLMSPALAGHPAAAPFQQVARGGAQAFDPRRLAGFTAAKSRLGRLSGGGVEALLTDLDAVVVEALLLKQGVRRLALSRAGGPAVRLSATL